MTTRTTQFSQYRPFRIAAAALALSAVCTAGQAQSGDDALSLLDGALAEIQASGLDNAVKNFNDGARWKKGTHQLVAVQLDGTVLAHSANARLPGKSMLEARDASGKTFVKDAIQLVKTRGSGHVDMRWGNPVTRQIADGTMYVRRVPGQDVVIGALVFK